MPPITPFFGGIRSLVPITQLHDLFGDEEAIVEDRDIDPGTYQGGKKEAKEIEKKKLSNLLPIYLRQHGRHGEAGFLQKFKNLLDQWQHDTLLIS